MFFLENRQFSTHRNKQGSCVQKWTHFLMSLCVGMPIPRERM